MAGRFAYSKPNRRGPNDPWFRIGNLDIGSAALLGLLCAVSVLVYAIDKTILIRLALIPDEITSGQVWRIVTWPLANGFDRQLLWVIVSIAVLWYFGSRLEEQVGRTKFAWFLTLIILIPGLVGTALDLPQAGVHTVQLVVLLTFIAEYPNVRFFFGIPAWVLGAVYVAAEVLQLTGDRAGRDLLFFVVALSGCRARRTRRRHARGVPVDPQALDATSTPRTEAKQATRSGRRTVGRHQYEFGRAERARRAARQDQRDRYELAEQG